MCHIRYAFIMKWLVLSKVCAVGTENMQHIFVQNIFYIIQLWGFFVHSSARYPILNYFICFPVVIFHTLFHISVYPLKNTDLIHSSGKTVLVYFSKNNKKEYCSPFKINRFIVT